MQSSVTLNSILENTSIYIHIFWKGLHPPICLPQKGSGILASAKYLREQASGAPPTVSRDYQIKSFNQTLSVTRNVDITFCKVWDLESDFFDAFFTLFVIVLPLFFGPVLTALLEIYQVIRRLRTKSPPVERSNRRRHLCLVYVLASISIGTYLANLYLVEGVIFRFSL